MDETLQKEARAMQALLKLMEDARECRRLFEAARLDLPRPLLRFLGEDDGLRQPPKPKLRIPPPTEPSRPAEAVADSIWVRYSELTPTTLVLGILRRAKRTLSLKELQREVRTVKPQQNWGTVANIGTRLAADQFIERNEDGWRLLQADKAPVLEGGFAWGPVQAFLKYEVAAHRRNVILHLLNLNSAGLQASQVVSMLSQCDWFKAPSGKDLVKMDLEDLAKEGKAKRGSSRKWKAVTPGKEKSTIGGVM